MGSGDGDRITRLTTTQPATFFDRPALQAERARTPWLSLWQSQFTVTAAGGAGLGICQP
jgi:hypothetical protein